MFVLRARGTSGDVDLKLLAISDGATLIVVPAPGCNTRVAQ
jgi:hypothetical protein